MTPKSITIHHSLTSDNQTMDYAGFWRHHVEVRGWADIGYHYVIEAIESRYYIIKGRLDTQVGAHTKGHNTDNVGICLAGNFDLAPPPAAQWDKAVALVRSLLQLYRLTPGDVFGHREWLRGYACPGKYFDLAAFRAAVT